MGSRTVIQRPGNHFLIKAEPYRPPIITVPMVVSTFIGTPSSRKATLNQVMVHRLATGNTISVNQLPLRSRRSQYQIAPKARLSGGGDLARDSKSAAQAWFLLDTRCSGSAR